MRVILDSNVLISALITRGTAPDRLYEAWRDGRFTLVTCELQLDEVRRVTRREGLRFRIHAAEAGRLVNDLRRLATMVHELSAVEISPDPYGKFLSRWRGPREPMGLSAATSAACWPWAHIAGRAS